MSVTTEIMRINGGKSGIKTLLSQKNIPIVDGTLISDYPSILASKWPECTFGVTYEGSKIRGSTRKWNQQANIESYVVNGLSITVNGTNIRIQGTCTQSIIVSTGARPVKNDKIFIYLKYTIRDQLTGNYLFQDGHGAFSQTVIYTHTANNVYPYYFYFNQGDVVDRDIDIQINDLTKMFGSGNEPSSIESLDIYNIIVYGHNNPLVDSGSIDYGYYKGCKLEQYDYIDTSSNNLVVKSKTITIDGTEEFIASYQMQTSGTFVVANSFVYNDQMVADVLPTIPIGLLNEGISGICGNSEHYFYINFGRTFSSVAEIRSYLSEHPITVSFELETPTVIPLQ